ncbi:MAG: DMT family transporter, partial [Anaerolineae bacterium]
SVVLVTTNPLFVGLISHFFLQEHMTRRVFSGMLIAIIGSAIIGLGDLGEGTHHLIGDLLALAGAIAIAVHMLLGRRLRKHLSLLGYVFPVYATAAFVLMALTLVTGTKAAGYPSTAWLWLILVAVIPQIIGHSSFNWALGHLPATYVALAVLAEPIGSSILAWLILHEPPAPVTVVGGALILAGIGIAVRPNRQGR